VLCWNTPFFKFRAAFNGFGVGRSPLCSAGSACPARVRGEILLQWKRMTLKMETSTGFAPRNGHVCSAFISATLQKKCPGYEDPEEEKKERSRTYCTWTDLTPLFWDSIQSRFPDNSPWFAIEACSRLSKNMKIFHRDLQDKPSCC